MKIGRQEKEKIQLNTSLRVDEKSSILKVESTPCIFIDVTLGNKNDERILIFEKDDPKIVAKQFCQNHSKALNRVKH